MKYILMVYEDESRLTDEIHESCRVEASQICHELAGAGKLIAASPLQPTSLATSVRVREGKRLVTDGPFAETREQLGGFFLIDAADLDEAIAIASRLPMVQRGTIEVRPLVEMPGLPPAKL
jgi:hypothetical protein